MNVYTRKIVYVAVVILLMAVYGVYLWRAEARRGSSATLRGDGTYLIGAAGYVDAIRFTANREPAGAFFDLRLIESHETLNYASPEEIRLFLSRLDGSARNEISEIDGITGATDTSNAIKNVLLEVEHTGRRRWARTALSVGLWLLVFAFALLRRSGALLLTGAVWFIVIGVAFNAPLSAYAFLTPTVFLPLFPAFALSSVLLYRNLYCRHICPFGFLQHMIRFLPIKRRYHISREMQIDKYIVLGLVIISSILGRQFYLEPYSFIFSRKLIWWLYILPVAMLALSTLLPGLWCRAFCPVGAIMRIGDTIRRFGLKGHAPRIHPTAHRWRGRAWLSAFTFLLLILGNLLPYVT